MRTEVFRVTICVRTGVLRNMICMRAGGYSVHIAMQTTNQGESEIKNARSSFLVKPFLSFYVVGKGLKGKNFITFS